MNRAQFEGMIRMISGSFSNGRHIFESQVAEGDWVATRMTWTALHTGDFNGIPASNRPVRAADIEAAYYLAILRFVGCATTAHEISQFLDELALGKVLAAPDEEVALEMARALAAVMPEAEAKAMARQMAASLGSPRFAEHHRNHCEAAELIAKRLGLGSAVVSGLAHVYEGWDRHGVL